MTCNDREIGSSTLEWPAQRGRRPGFRKRVTGWKPVLFLLFVSGCGDGDPSDSIRVSGNIEMTQVEVAFRLSGRVAELAVGEGDSVQRGNVVARLDSDQLEWQHRQATATREALESRGSELETQLRYQQANRDSQVRQREADLEQAEARLRQLRSGSRPQETEQARAELQRAQARHEKAQSDLKRAETLVAEEDISRNQYGEFKTTFEAAAATLQQAREQLSLVEEGPRSEDIDAARAQVAKARAGLDQALSLDLEIARSRQSLRTLGAEIQRAEAAVGQIEDEIEDARAVAPIDGVVLRKNVEIGEVVAAGTPLMSLGDIDRPWMRGYISETELGRVKLGSRVRVTTDSFPGKVYEGRVTFIASEAEFTPKQIQTAEERVKLVYRIKVEVENPDRELKLNMPCDAEIALSGLAS